MVNNYPHQQEMDEILQDLKDYTNSSKGKYGMTPFEVIRSFKHDMNIVMENGSYSENNESYFALSNLEEAAVLKNFGLWFQQEYRDMFNK